MKKTKNLKKLVIFFAAFATSAFADLETNDVQSISPFLRKNKSVSQLIPELNTLLQNENRESLDSLLERWIKEKKKNAVILKRAKNQDVIHALKDIYDIYNHLTEPSSDNEIYDTEDSQIINADPWYYIDEPTNTTDFERRQESPIDIEYQEKESEEDQQKEASNQSNNCECFQDPQNTQNEEEEALLQIIKKASKGQIENEEEAQNIQAFLFNSLKDAVFWANQENTFPQEQSELEQKSYDNEDLVNSLRDDGAESNAAHDGSLNTDSRQNDGDLSNLAALTEEISADDQSTQHTKNTSAFLTTDDDNSEFIQSSQFGSGEKERDADDIVYFSGVSSENPSQDLSDSSETESPEVKTNLFGKRIADSYALMEPLALKKDKSPERITKMLEIFAEAFQNGNVDFNELKKHYKTLGYIARSKSNQKILEAFQALYDILSNQK
jgi:hypothetical protein